MPATSRASARVVCILNLFVSQANIETYRKEIERSINNDIVLRHGYAQGVVARSLPDDKEVQQAAALLQDPQEYRRILTEQDTRRK